MSKEPVMVKKVFEFLRRNIRGQQKVIPTPQSTRFRTG